jgi:hypothetical protein
MEPNYQTILQGKIDYYGETKAAYHFAAEEYARQYHTWMQSRQADVGGSLGFDKGYEQGYNDATREACQEIAKNYQPNDR